MPKFIQFREFMRSFISHHEYLVRRIWNAVIMIISMTAITRAFPADGVFGSGLLNWLVILLSIFLPFSGCILVLMVVLLLHISIVSLMAALIIGGVMGLGYLIQAYYQSKAGYELILLPIFRQIGLPFVTPMANGLLGQMNDVAGIVIGGILSFMIRTISENQALLADRQSNTNLLSLLMSQVFQNVEFYFYLVSVIAVFLISYLIRTAHIRFSWAVAVIASLLAEFVIMFAGCLFTNNRDDIGGLLFGNLISLMIGLIMTYFFMDLNYRRIENVQFEDDDYYYYVTAVPKVHMPKEKKTVKKITNSRSSDRV